MVIVHHVDVLLPVVERIQAAVRVFFCLKRGNQIELILIGKPCSKQPDHAVGIGIEKPAEVVVKIL